MRSFGSWVAVIDGRGSWGRKRRGICLVSDGDAAIAAGIDLVCGRGAPHRLRVFHLRREYWRNLGAIGFVEARRLLRSASLAEGREWARRLVRLPAGAAAYWCQKALSKGRRHLTPGQAGHRTPSRLERHNQELRRREKPGRVGTAHNLLALLPIQGLFNPTA